GRFRDLVRAYDPTRGVPFEGYIRPALERAMLSAAQQLERPYRHEVELEDASQPFERAGGGLGWPRHAGDPARRRSLRPCPDYGPPAADLPPPGGGRGEL